MKRAYLEDDYLLFFFLKVPRLYDAENTDFEHSY